MSRLFKHILPSFIAASFTALLPMKSFAQTGPYQNLTSAPVNETATSCSGTPLTRTISVADSFTIADVDFGFTIDHTYRGDLQVRLQSPSGTEITLVTNDGGNGNANYDVLFDDDATDAVNTGSHVGQDTTGAPYYDNPVSPQAALSAFNGEEANGTWTVEVCDIYNGDSGTFRRAELFFEALTGADLSLDLVASTTTPNYESFVTYTVTVSNIGVDTASGVTVNMPMPTGLTWSSDTSGGAYNPTTGIWTLPSALVNGGNASLSVTAFVENSGAYIVDAEIASSSENDVDSTPGNGSNTEDDDDRITFNPQVGTIPTLSCPGPADLVDWDTLSWTNGQMSGSTTIGSANIPVSLNITDANNALINFPNTTNATPLLGTQLTGGITPAENNLIVVADQPNRQGTIDFKLDFGTPGEGVDKVQFSIFDVDFNANQFEDRIVVTGSLDGNAVTPILTAGTANSVTGNVALGNGASESNASPGNVHVRFDDAVDTITFTYGNGDNTPVDPGQHAIGLYDIQVCERQIAVLEGEKTRTMYDPTNIGLYAIPGNDVIYTITMTNTGNGATDADSVFIVDTMPSEVEFFNGDMDGPGPATDPVNGVDTGSGLTLDYATDVGFSSGATKPTSMAECSYTPTSGYDPNVTFVCVNPSGEMAAGDPSPTYAVSFRARIK